MDNCMFTLMLKMLAHMILLKQSQTWIVPFFFFLMYVGKRMFLVTYT